MIVERWVRSCCDCINQWILVKEKVVVLWKLSYPVDIVVNWSKSSNNEKNKFITRKRKTCSFMERPCSNI